MSVVICLHHIPMKLAPLTCYIESKLLLIRAQGDASLVEVDARAQAAHHD